MTIVGILHHPYKPENQRATADILAWLEARGIVAWTGSTWDPEGVRRQVERSAFLVVVGGDGTTLQAARLAAPHGVPLFSVNMGRVGFLSEAAPDEWAEKLAKVLHGEHRLEQRLMLAATLFRGGEETTSFVALNDVVVARGGQMRVLRMVLRINDMHVATYTADALIAATPTGSTAYSMAAGGPLLLPELRNYMVLPVAPHLSLDRALVLPEDATVHIELHSGHDAILTTDGQETIALQNGDQVKVQRHNFDASFIRLERTSYYYERLAARLRD